MNRILFVAVIASLLAACSKGKFETVPKVEIKEFGPNEVVKGNLIELRAIVLDQEGDIQDSLLVVRKLYNVNTGQQVGSSDTNRLTIRPLGAPPKQETELFVRFLYGELKPDVAPIENLVSVDRGYTLGLIVIDRAGNRSQYVESKRILLKKL